jgi:hypothetical protein
MIAINKGSFNLKSKMKKESNDVSHVFSKKNKSVDLRNATFGLEKGRSHSLLEDKFV